MSKMKLTETNEYNKHGCNFTGNLVVVELPPPSGRWGAMSCFGHTEEAERLVSEKYDSFTRLLSIPDYVVRLDE